MGRKAKFQKEHFLDAALRLIAQHGPGSITISAIAKETSAPIGSVYHRFASREILLAELWLRLIKSFQQGFIEALDQGDGLQAALYTPRWVRKNLEEASVLLLYRRDELTSGEWPESIKDCAEELGQNLEKKIRAFTKHLFGNVKKQSLNRTMFALIEAPYAAVRRHLQAREALPAIVEELVQETYFAIIGRFSED